MKIIDNFLDHEDLDSLSKLIQDKINQLGWQTSQDFYKHEIGGAILTSINPFLYEITDTHKDFIIKILSDNNILQTKPDLFVALIQVAQPLASIEWHTDTHSSYDEPGSEDPYDVIGITLYFNKEWNHNWGGYFCSKESKENTQGVFVQPVYNRLVINDGLEPHAVTPIDRSADDRITIQLFVSRSSISGVYLT
tara:strand:- start:3895 stop:4476 length:582 start_codon:yes stop_codon:yes gene_type:complete